MIRVTQLNGKHFYINADHIEYFETTPDTLVILTTGRKFIIQESPKELIDRFVEYKNRIYSSLPLHRDALIPPGETPE